MELAGEIRGGLTFKFLNKAIPIFLLHNERRYVKVEAPILDEILSLGIIMLLALDTYDTLTMQVKCERNKALFEVTNDSTQLIALDPKKAIAVLNIRSLGY